MACACLYNTYVCIIDTVYTVCRPMYVIHNAGTTMGLICQRLVLLALRVDLISDRASCTTLIALSICMSVYDIYLYPNARWQLTGYCLGQREMITFSILTLLVAKT